MSTNPSSQRQRFSRLSALVALFLVIGLLPSVADSVASAQSGDESSAESGESPDAPATAVSGAADQTTSSTAAVGGSSETSVVESGPDDTDETGSASETTATSEDQRSTPTETTGSATDTSAVDNGTSTSAAPSVATPTSTSTTEVVDGAQTDPAEQDPDVASDGESAETADGVDDGTDASADETVDASAEEVLDETGDGETIISEKLEPLPGFTGGGAVISSNPIRRLGGGWYEQPVMVVGRNATAEIEAAIRDAEQQGSADARALIEVQTRISELSTANGIEVDSVGAVEADVEVGAESDANVEAAGAAEPVVSAAELARRAAWEDVLDQSRSRMLSGTASRAVALTELETKRTAVVAATDVIAESEILTDEARAEAQTRARAERDAQQRADDAREHSIRSEALATTAERTVTRYEGLVEEARADATKAVQVYERRRLDLRAVAVAWYVGSEVLAGNAGDLVEATTSGNRVEIGRVEALSLLDDRRALLQTATDDLTNAQAMFSNRRFAVREAKAALATALDETATARSAEASATRSAALTKRLAAKALADFGDAEAALDVDRRRLVVATRERDALIARIEAVSTELVGARESYATASLELGLDVSQADLAVLEAAIDDHDHFAEVLDGDHPDHPGHADHAGQSDHTADSDDAGGAADGDDGETPAAALSSTSSTEPVPTPEELAALVAADAAARAEDERLAAERAEQEAEAEDRRQQAEAEIAALKAQAKELTERRGLAPAALRSLLNSSSVTFPIAGKWNFIDSWGFPRSGGRRHKGSDIFAPQGTPLVAIEDGRVSSKTNKLGGNVVYLYGDSGNTYYYAHLSAFHPRARAGGRIKAGEVLGFVGTSGNARGTPPHLHIGLKGPGTSAINPYPLMRALSEAVVAEQGRGARASVSPFVMPNLSAEVIAQLVAEGVPLLPSVIDALPPDVKADLQRRGIL